MTTYFIIAVILGAGMIVAVVANYLRAVPIQSTTVTVTIVFLGFVLVSTPMWGSITVKGESFELVLLRDLSRNYIKLAESAKHLVSPDSQAELSTQVERLKEITNALEENRRLSSGTLLFFKGAADRTLEITTPFVNAAVEG